MARLRRLRSVVCSGILLENKFVTAYPGVMIDVAGFGHTHNRMNEQVCFVFPRGAEGQFLVSAVHRISRLKSDNPPPA